MMLLEDRRVVYSHNVVFNENVFPLKDSHSPFSVQHGSDYPEDLRDDSNSGLEMLPESSLEEAGED